MTVQQDPFKTSPALYGNFDNSLPVPQLLDSKSLHIEIQDPVLT